jgi:signal transduction histidine kinase
MTRLIPRSLLGQVMLALAFGLILGQAISAALLLSAAEQRREASLIHSIALQAVAAERRDSRTDRHAEHLRRLHAEQTRQGEMRAARRMRMAGMRVQYTPDYPIGANEVRDQELEQALGAVLTDEGLAPSQLAIVRRSPQSDPFIQSRPRLRERLAERDLNRQPLIVAALQQESGGDWLVIRTIQPPGPRGIFTSILLQTIVTSLVLFLLLFLLLRRITRPLEQLTTRVDHFTRQPDRAIALEESGPDDVRKLISAHNAMEARIASMLDEKDVMLGAIGHDLKTPLAALRVRIESVEDEDQRARMAQSIEDITATLDDILSLARIGRPGPPPEPTDISALVAGIVEEFEDMGEPVELDLGARVTCAVRPTWIRRAVRNLIGNALRYGQCARVNVAADEKSVTISIEDEGPGIPEGHAEEMMEPFRRGEASRNRNTGGAGLGLTIARAVAEQHGGRLILSNRAEGGLRAEIELPRDQGGVPFP